MSEGGQVYVAQINLCQFYEKEKYWEQPAAGHPSSEDFKLTKQKNFADTDKRRAGRHGVYATWLWFSFGSVWFRLFWRGFWPLQSANEINANCCHMPEICICILEYVPSRSPRIFRYVSSWSASPSLCLLIIPPLAPRHNLRARELALIIKSDHFVVVSSFAQHVALGCASSAAKPEPMVVSSPTLCGRCPAEQRRRMACSRATRWVRGLRDTGYRIPQGLRVFGGGEVFKPKLE